MSAISWLADYIFPQFCVGCRREGALVCSECFSKTTVSFSSRVITKYNKELTHYYFHTHDTETVISKLIMGYKYQFQTSALSYLSKFIIEESFFTEYLSLMEIDALVPIPLHSRRLAERGFNQAFDIATICSQATGIPVAQLLIRKKRTKQQALLRDKEERVKNMKDVFMLQKLIPQYARVLLIDDVVTSGATAFAAKEVLEGEGMDVAVMSVEKG